MNRDSRGQSTGVVLQSGGWTNARHKNEYVNEMLYAIELLLQTQLSQWMLFTEKIVIYCENDT
jgi:hypothetical protein